MGSPITIQMEIGEGDTEREVTKDFPSGDTENLPRDDIET